MTVALNRYSTTGVSPTKLGVVIHDSETGDGSYANLITALSKPGTQLIQGSSPPRYIGASYHALTRNDLGATYDQVLPETAGPFAAPPLNKTWLHICIPGYARQTRDEWLDQASRSGIRAVAKFCVDKSRVHGFPLELRTVTELQAGIGGLCFHADVSDAWGATDHWDPGPLFPDDILMADIAELTHPITPHPEDDMEYLVHYPAMPDAAGNPPQGWTLMRMCGADLHHVGGPFGDWLPTLRKHIADELVVSTASAFEAMVDRLRPIGQAPDGVPQNVKDAWNARSV